MTPVCSREERDRVSAEQTPSPREASSPLRLSLLRTKLDLLTEEAEVRVVTEQAEHDEVGVQSVEAVAYIRVITRLSLLEPNVLHDFVLSFSRDLQRVE